ncbi:MAG: hypothetical protein MZV64_24110 [Ignavibacteriales bacterium]|nr:hypothetical protein [Ignavibacteriales bacterium]
MRLQRNRRQRRHPAQDRRPMRHHRLRPAAGEPRDRHGQPDLPRAGPAIAGRHSRHGWRLLHLHRRPR